MTHRIIEVKALENFVVSVVFQDGIEKVYDIRSLYSKYPQFLTFESNVELFEKVQVDVGGCGISWNDDLDLSSEEIWDNGELTDTVHKVDVLSELGASLTKARDRARVTQKELAEKVRIYQGDISKIERGAANPSVKTLQRLAEGMGMRVKIEFECNR